MVVVVVVVGGKDKRHKMPLKNKHVAVVLHLLLMLLCDSISS